MRADKFLWQARFFKTRTLAGALVTGGHLRVNGNRVAKPAHALKLGDTLTFPQARRVRVVRIIAFPTRRGPASEAQGLYDDLSPPVARTDGEPKPESGRVDRKDRRAARLSKHGPLE